MNDAQEGCVRMADYFKATRLDGTDFKTGTVLYEAGKRTTHPTSKRRTKDDPYTYLSVSTTATDCTGFEWPCRLFLVKGVGRAMTATDLPNKRAFLAVDVIEELPAYEVFGPQGELVVSLIERAGGLTVNEIKKLVAVWATAGSAALDAAWSAARSAGRGAALNAAGSAALNAVGSASAVGYAAGYAAANVADALIVRDLIGSRFTQAHYDSLTGPWRRVVGRVHPDDAEFKF